MHTITPADSLPAGVFVFVFVTARGIRSCPVLVPKGGLWPVSQLSLHAGIGRKGGIKPYLFILPMLVLAVTFVYYPFAKTFLYSFTTVNFKGEITGYAGLDNYAYLVGRRDFSKAIGNTLRLTLMNVPVTIVIALALALLSERRRALSPVWETMFSLPMAVSMSAAALIFKVLLNPTVGYVNYTLGLDWGWFRDKETALTGILSLTVWMGIGFPYLLLLGALRGVPA